MKRDIPLALFFIVVLAGAAFLVAGKPYMSGQFFGDMSPEAVDEPEPVVSMVADKGVYSSGDRMVARVRVENGEGEADIKLYGIKDRRGNYRVQASKTVELGEGFEEEFAFTMPRCYGCAGVSPGEYQVVAELSRNGTVLSSGHINVSLRR